jgi:phage gpG-like protein
MASDVFKLEVVGLESIDKIANNLDQNFNIDKILDEGAAVIFNRVRTRFIHAVDPQGVPWIVSQAAKERELNGRGGLTGYDTGDLFHSLQLFSGTGNEREIGTDVFYAPFFQYSPPKAARQRIFLDFGPEDEPYMLQLVALRIQEALSV